MNPVDRAIKESVQGDIDKMLAGMETVMGVKGAKPYLQKVVGHNKIYDLLQSGELPNKQLGKNGKYLINKYDLVSFIMHRKEANDANS